MRCANYCCGKHFYSKQVNFKSSCLYHDLIVGYCRSEKIFTLKIIRVKNFHVVKFSWFRIIRKIFLTVDDHNMDECMESSYRLVYYRVSGEPGSAGYSCRSDIYPGGCGLACARLFVDCQRVSLIFACWNFMVGRDHENIKGLASYSHQPLLSLYRQIVAHNIDRCINVLSLL